MNFLKRIGLSPFILTLFGAILAARLFPSWGAAHESWSPAQTAGRGVCVVFFLYGLRLGREKLKAGMRNIRLHVLVQTVTFVLFPLLTLGVMTLTDIRPHYYLWLGVFFLSALPSTVSSSVVMVSMARGNVPAAIFDASISSLAGVFATPLWMSLFLTAGADGNSLGDAVVSLVLQVAVPVAAGAALHRRWGGFAENHRRALDFLDQTVIIAIVYTSFCESFSTHMFDSVSWGTLAALTGGSAALFLLMFCVIGRICDLMRFSREDKTAALFCGSKKSLVHGAAMSKALLADPALAGVLLLPVMIYHAVQLILASVIAGRIAGGKA